MRWTTVLVLTLAIAALPTARAMGADEVREHPGGLIQSSWLDDRPVVDRHGSELGKIKEVWFDPRSGQVKEVMIDLINGRHAIVPWKDLGVTWENQKLVVRADAQKLARAPSAARYERRGPPAASPPTGSK